MNNQHPVYPGSRGTDPREKLVTTGSHLLDTIYTMRLWEQRYPELFQLMESTKAGHEPDGVDISRVMSENIEGILQSLTLSSEYTRLLNEYITLRQTIEALDSPRSDMSGYNL
jgi:hypothetical protein